MNRRTAFAVAAATITTLGTGAVAAAAMSGSDGPRIEVVASPTTTEDTSPTSTRKSVAVTRVETDDTSTTTRTTAPTTTRSTDDNAERSTSTTTRTTTPPAPSSPTANTATFRSIGGEIDVTWTTRTLTIVAVRPAAGFRVESEEEDGDEVEAEFESGARDSKITVRLVNGSPSASVRERVDGGGEDDHGGNGGRDDDGGNSGREDDHRGNSGRG